MKTGSRNPRNGAPGRRDAFTRKELIVVVVGVLFFGLVLPMCMTNGTTRPRPRPSCQQNLNKIGMAFRMWSNEHGDAYPMRVSTNAGGAREYAEAGDVGRVFQVLAESLDNPKTLVCPQHRLAPAGSFRKLTNGNISYFINLDASPTNSNNWLAGDANLMIGGAAVGSGVFALTNGQEVGWAPTRHAGVGFVLFADGSVQRVLSPTRNATPVTNNPAAMRLIIP